MLLVPLEGPSSVGAEELARTKAGRPPCRLHPPPRVPRPPPPHLRGGQLSECSFTDFGSSLSVLICGVEPFYKSLRTSFQVSLKTKEP